MSETPAQAFKRAVQQVGGPAAAAAIFREGGEDCTRQNVHQLLERGSECPPRYVRLLSAASGVRRCALAPSIYPEADEPPGAPPGWGVRAEPATTARDLEAAGQLTLLETAEGATDGGEEGR